MPVNHSDSHGDSHGNTFAAWFLVICILIASFAGAVLLVFDLKVFLWPCLALVAVGILGGAFFKKRAQQKH